MRKATVRAGSNIAFIKYWGVSDSQWNLPLTSSISMTLADAFTTTTVEWTPDAPADEYSIGGRPWPVDAAGRLQGHVDRIREVASTQDRVRVVSQNNFPMASGIASSASGFAALTVAACSARDLDLPDRVLSRLARRGSGSACRSIFGGYVYWDMGQDDATSVARELFSAEYWSLCDVVAVVSDVEKATSSAAGHRLAASSPLNAGRVEHVNAILPAVEEAIKCRDLAMLGPLIEMDALAMHAVMMTSTPGLFYWLPGTLEILTAIRGWRKDGLDAYFTIDAGPNVHVICESEWAGEVQSRLRALSCVEDLIVSSPGPAPYEIDDHLF